jgi:hypothetical protein
MFFIHARQQMTREVYVRIMYSPAIISRELVLLSLADAGETRNELFHRDDRWGIEVQI